MNKNPSLGAALLMVLIVTGIFTFGLFSAVQRENKATGAAGLEKVMGMDR
ncbi:MAG: hypothetical protein Q7J54_05120 [Candidatus Woesearchaeota archaeon]|nr:hypothetical protein [Candidatus Woesearchaeota archaeon]